jgi:branched-chain amino acid transport system permease protein
MTPSTGRGSTALVGMVFLVAAALPFVSDPYTLHLAVLSGISVIAASSLNLIMGYVGKLSLGHSAFFGIGAYTSALLSMSAGAQSGYQCWRRYRPQQSWLCLSALVLWLRGAYFIIVTLSFSIVLQIVMINWVDLTNGPMGILNVPIRPCTFELATRTSYFYLILISAGATIWCIQRLIQSRTGRAFEALRENEDVAVSIGVSKLHYSLLAFCIAAGFAGFAGALYAHYVSVITPSCSASM